MLDLTSAFRGSTAVYAPAGLDPDLALRARAAGVLVAGRGVVAGYAAAELLDASSGPADASVDVLVPYSYRCPGLRVHRGRLPPDEVVCVGGARVTTATRAAFDLGRWAPSLTERVAAVDALVYHCAIDLDAVRELRNRHLGVRRGNLVAEVLAPADRRAESPMESRVRMALYLGGLPPPAVQHPVVARHTRYHLDLAYPHALLAIEYDGADHRLQARARRDLLREAALTELGWKILRFDADVVLFRPGRIAAVVRAELAARSGR